MSKTQEDRETAYNPSYQKLLVHGYDTVKEVFRVIIPEELKTRLNNAKALANEMNDSLKDGAPFELGGYMFRISKGGGKGVTWWLTGEFFEMHITDKNDWGVSVRYSSLGLWHRGITELRNEVFWIMEKEFRPIACEQDQEWYKVSEVHYCFDFHSPKLTKSMRPNILHLISAHSSTKVDAKAKPSGQIETLTIGYSPRGKTPCEIQLYNKGEEITSKGDKMWFLDVWEKNSDYVRQSDGKITDVWRVEIRMRKDFIRKKQIQNSEYKVGIDQKQDFKKYLENFDDLILWLPELLNEAMRKKAILKRDRKNKNRARWRFHEIWSAVLEEIITFTPEFIPVGHNSRLSGESLHTMLKAQVAGVLRAMSVLTVGDQDHLEMEAMAHEAIARAEKDVDRKRKTQNLQSRYQFKSIYMEN